jgi:hypothetical protein
VSFAHRRPLHGQFSSLLEHIERYSTDIQFVAFSVRSLFAFIVNDLPIVFNRLYDETQCRTDAVDIFVHDLLHYGRLPCIVQSPYAVSLRCSKQIPDHPQHEYSHLLVLQSRFPQYREHLASSHFRKCYCCVSARQTLHERMSLLFSAKPALRAVRYQQYNHETVDNLENFNEVNT